MEIVKVGRITNMRFKFGGIWKDKESNLLPIIVLNNNTAGANYYLIDKDFSGYTLYKRKNEFPVYSGNYVEEAYSAYNYLSKDVIKLRKNSYVPIIKECLLASINSETEDMLSYEELLNDGTFRVSFKLWKDKLHKLDTETKQNSKIHSFD